MFLLNWIICFNVVVLVWFIWGCYRCSMVVCSVWNFVFRVVRLKLFECCLCLCFVVVLWLLWGFGFRFFDLSFCLCLFWVVFIFCVMLFNMVCVWLCSVLFDIVFLWGLLVWVKMFYLVRIVFMWDRINVERFKIVFLLCVLSVFVLVVVLKEWEVEVKVVRVFCFVVKN